MKVQIPLIFIYFAVFPATQNYKEDHATQQAYKDEDKLKTTINNCIVIIFVCIYTQNRGVDNLWKVL